MIENIFSDGDWVGKKEIDNMIRTTYIRSEYEFFWYTTLNIRMNETNLKIDNLYSFENEEGEFDIAICRVNMPFKGYPIKVRSLITPTTNYYWFNATVPDIIYSSLDEDYTLRVYSLLEYLCSSSLYDYMKERFD